MSNRGLTLPLLTVSKYSSFSIFEIPAFEILVYSQHGLCYVLVNVAGSLET